MRNIAALFLTLALLFTCVACTNPENESSDRDAERESSSVSDNTSPEKPDGGEDNTVDIGDLTNGMQR